MADRVAVMYLGRVVEPVKGLLGVLQARMGSSFTQ